jgi:hypothetical protein
MDKHTQQLQAPAAQLQSSPHEHVADSQLGMMISLGSERVFCGKGSTLYLDVCIKVSCRFLSSELSEDVGQSGAF